ncbi:isocitrate lyase/phosphoenolpyruvate mutase family protein, partial [Burkholderia stabilis]
PGITDAGEIAAVTQAVGAPVNVVMGLQGGLLSLDELAALGVKRVSVGGALARAALGAFLRAATEMARDGTFTFTQAAVPGRDVNRWFAAPDNSPVSFGE